MKPSPVVDLTGRRFGKLVVVSRNGADRFGCAKWLVRCDCGNERSMRGSKLNAGQRGSCGCAKRDRKISPSHATPRPKRKPRTTPLPPEYQVWTGMVGRCRNPKNYSWDFYGGRGITVCERWLDFKNFVADMGPRPPGLTIDRIDSNGNYEPGNCRWATKTEQNRNTRRNHWVLIDGAPMIIADAARALNVCESTIQKRVRLGKIVSLGNGFTN